MAIILPTYACFPRQCSTWISDAFAATFFVIGYSIFITTIFGHPSFFRHYDFTDFCLVCRNTTAVREVESTEKRIFDFIDVNIQLEMMYYLTAANLIVVSQISHYYARLVDQKELWVNLGKRNFSSEIILKQQSFDCKLKYFCQIRQYPLIFAKSRKGLNLVIDGAVYDLTTFVQEHPGGEGILLEWDGKDASKPFSIALHSRVALKLAKKYLIWSHDK